MNVTFRQLRVFEAVARNLSYTRAAQELYLTQPAVSMQIRQLEENVGLPMFEQIGKKIFLTQAGDEMYIYSRAIAQQLEEADEVIEELKGLKRGHLSVAVATTAIYFATQLLAAFSRAHSGTTLSLEVSNRAHLIEMLENNEKDLVIMGQPPQELDLEAQPFMQNPLVVIAAPDHPLVQESNIPLERLQEETFVVREHGSGTRIAMERLFKEQEIDLVTGMEMGNNEAIKQSVMAGLGLGIVSLHTLELELTANRLKVLDIESFPVERQWFVVHRRGKRLSPIAETFHDFITSEASNVWPMPAY